jgi:hypothetical protein
MIPSAPADGLRGKRSLALRSRGRTLGGGFSFARPRFTA